MSRIRIAAVAVAIAASAATAAPAGAAQDPPRCDPGPCIGDALQQKLEPVTEEAIWVVRCIGDSLGGNACHQ